LRLTGFKLFLGQFAPLTLKFKDMVKTMIYIKKDKARLNGECPIYIKIVLNKKTTTVSTDKYLSEKRWIETNGLRLVLRSEKEKVIMEYLNLFILKIEKLYNQIEKFGDIKRTRTDALKFLLIL
jgi:hypothetical protein